MSTSLPAETTEAIIRLRGNVLCQEKIAGLIPEDPHHGFNSQSQTAYNQEPHITFEVVLKVDAYYHPKEDGTPLDTSDFPDRPDARLKDVHCHATPSKNKLDG